MINFISKLATIFLQNTLPQTCVLCCASVKRNIALCSACEQDLPFMLNCCKRCGSLVPVNTSLCGACMKNPPSFDRTIALFEYKPPIVQLIADLKFHHKLIHIPWIAHLLGKRLCTVYAENNWPEHIVPVPLHSSRLRERGFNQSLEIARILSKQLQIPLDTQSSKRIRLTDKQSNLSTADLRTKNVRGAFSIDKKWLSAKHIAIVDDVMTTGSTVSELSRVFKKAGVHLIDIWCVARTNDLLRY